MLYSLSLVVILTSVLIGRSLVDAGISDVQLEKFHKILFHAKCAFWSNDKELKQFDDCYSKKRNSEDSKGCKKGSKDKYDKCVKHLDQEKIGDAKGIMAACKANGNTDEDIRRMIKFSRCVFRVRNSLCKNSSLENEYQKSLKHARKARECVHNQ